MDLKSFREDKLHMTQTQFANLLGLQQNHLSKLEKNPDSISIDLLIKIAKATGCTPDEIIGYQKDIPSALEVNDTWIESRSLKEKLLTYIRESYQSMPKAHRQAADDFAGFIYRIYKKPRIVFTGKSDSGKSTMINALLGVEKMPTAWSPTTSIIVYIKHIEDRPKYMNDELLVLKKDEKGRIVDDTVLYNNDKYSKYALANGTTDMLSSYGTRTGSAYSSEEVGSAIIFLDCPILKICDLVDVPGTTGGIESDNYSADYAPTGADIIVFLSQASGFLSTEDCAYLKQCLTRVSSINSENAAPFERLFIVASQAHHINATNPDGSDALDTILKSGCERLMKTIPDMVWKDFEQKIGQPCTAEDLQSRFYTYTTDIGRLRKSFEDALRRQIEIIAGQQLKQQLDITKKYISSQMETLAANEKQLQNALENHEAAREELQKRQDAEPERIISARVTKDKVHAYISTTKLKDKEKFKKYYEEALGEDCIIGIIDRKNLKNNKEDINILLSNIASLLELIFNRIIKSHNEEYKKLVDEYLSDYDAVTPDSKHSKVHMASGSFNAQRTFASGAAAAGTYGALSLWAASFGNLGGYIIASKAVSFLATLGISTGGTAPVMSALAAIGGPATIFVGLAALVGVSAFLASGSGWKNNLAKRIRKEYDSKDMLSQYYLSIDKYWDATEEEFNAGSLAVDLVWAEELKELEQIIESTSAEELKQQIGDVRYAYRFFSNTPSSCTEVPASMPSWL